MPALQARVTDLTGTLDTARRQGLEQRLAALEQRKGAQVAVLIVPTTAPDTIEQCATRLFDAWKLGRKGTDDGVLLIMANGQVFNQPGFIQTIEADFNNETGTIAFRAGFPNPEGLLRHGETGKVRMTVPLPDALLIPQKATFEVLEKRYCYVVDEKNTVHSRVITISNELPDLFAVSGGLKDGDRILLDGLRKVHENDVVEVEFEKPEEVYSNLDARAE